MQSAREDLKELIDRGNALQTLTYNPNAIHSAWQLSNAGPSQAEITAWERDVKAFSYRYLKDHYAYNLIISAFNTMGTFSISSVVNYLEKIYNDWDFWDAKEPKVDTQSESQKKKQPLYDVFISHANADKESYVDELKASLDKLKIKIFYDKDALEWGDDWKKVILEGVAKAEFAIIVISKNFFGREWTEKELNEFLNRQNHNRQKVILPILHNITVSELQEKYPSVANIQALDSSKYSCDEIALKFAAQLIKRLKS